MLAKMMRTIFICLILWCTGREVISQPYTSRNNYTGWWEDAESWDPAWISPLNLIDGTDIRINGYITLEGSLLFTGSACILTVFDTLVIKGDLFLNNNITLDIREGGIVIVRGNFSINNSTVITTGGYLIIAGDFINNSSDFGGSFTGIQDPARVFFLGTVPVIEHDLYPVLNCNDTNHLHYTFSGCNYGDSTDLTADPIYPFFRGYCGTFQAFSNSPVCEGDTLKLKVATDLPNASLSYRWEGPYGFSVTGSPPVIPGARVEMTGLYTVRLSYGGCELSDTLAVTVHGLPAVTAANDGPACEGETIHLTSSGGAKYSWSGPQGFVSLSDHPSLPDARAGMTGRYRVMATSTEGCKDTAATSVIVYTYPLAAAGPDRTLENIFETRMNAVPTESQSSEWSVLSGSATIVDLHSPSSMIKGLSAGENKLRWTLYNGQCEASDEVIITVIDLFIPSVITPNDDGKNDYFNIQGGSADIELIIFNRWGLVEYANDNYVNDWNGFNNNHTELPDDTYFYVVKLKNGDIIKGSVLIKR